MTHEAVDMKDFNEWWDSDIIRSSPFRRGSPKYWAWAAWEAAIKSEREACAKVCSEMYLEGDMNTGIAAQAIQARGEASIRGQA